MIAWSRTGSSWRPRLRCCLAWASLAGEFTRLIIWYGTAPFYIEWVGETGAAPDAEPARRSPCERLRRCAWCPRQSLRSVDAGALARKGLPSAVRGQPSIGKGARDEGQFREEDRRRVQFRVRPGHLHSTRRCRRVR